MEFEIKMDNQSLYNLYRNGVSIATFNSALEHRTAKMLEDLLNQVAFNKFVETLLKDIGKLKTELDKYEKPAA